MPMAKIISKNTTTKPVSSGHRPRRATQPCAQLDLLSFTDEIEALMRDVYPLLFVRAVLWHA